MYPQRDGSKSSHEIKRIRVRIAQLGWIKHELMAQQLAPDVLKLKLGISNAYVIRNQICIDSGFKSNPRDLIRILNPGGKLLLTHLHYDHCAGALRISRELGYTIYAHQDELHGMLHSSKGQGLIPRLIPIRARLGDRIWGIHDSTRFQLNSEWLSCIHTPGHTMGHTCYLYRDLIFLGDLARADPDGNPLFIASCWIDWNPELKRRSLRKLLDLEFELCCPGHGGVFPKQSLLKLCSRLF